MTFPQHEMFVQHFPLKETWWQQSVLHRSRLATHKPQCSQSSFKHCVPLTRRKDRNRQIRKFLSICVHRQYSSSENTRVLIHILGLMKLTIPIQKVCPCLKDSFLWHLPQNKWQFHKILIHLLSSPKEIYVELCLEKYSFYKDKMHFPKKKEKAILFFNSVQ